MRYGVFIVSFSKNSFEIGYAMISEEHSPQQLLRNAQHAEEAGFKFAMLSDHFHPWINRRNKPFAWSIPGALSQITKQMRFYWSNLPDYAVSSSNYASSSYYCFMMPHQICFVLGTGENLNEHIIGRVARLRCSGSNA